MRRLLEIAIPYVRGPLLGAFVLSAAGSATWVATRLPDANQTAAASTTPATKPEEESLRLRGDTLLVPDDIARGLGLTTAEATKPAKPRSLAPFQGRLALDTNTLGRARSRFAGEVVEVCPLAAGDRVKRGQCLAVVWSKDLGEKKSELVDAISKLRTDEHTLKQLQTLFKESGTAERSVREAERSVQADRIAVEKAERTLRSWRLCDDEIAMVRAEADEHAVKTEHADWARVEVRSPRDGVILEKNVAPGDIVDTSADLFKIGDLSRLVVWAHVFEEDLHLLREMPQPVKWSVAVSSRPGASLNGTLDHVAPVIDPNQNTALARGHVDNPRGELIVGQFVTVTVELPPPVGEVEVPSDAVVENGRDSVVFIRSTGGVFIRRRVEVARRFRDVIYLRSGVSAGETVVRAGAILLNDAFDRLPPGDM